MEGLTLKPRERKRLQVLNMVLGGICGVAEAAALTGLSQRQVWRLLEAYRSWSLYTLGTEGIKGQIA